MKVFRSAGSISLFKMALDIYPRPERVKKTSMILILTKTIILISIILINPLSFLFQAFLKSSIIKFAISIVSSVFILPIS